MRVDEHTVIHATMRNGDHWKLEKGALYRQSKLNAVLPDAWAFCGDRDACWFLDKVGERWSVLQVHDVWLEEMFVQEEQKII